MAVLTGITSKDPMLLTFFYRKQGTKHPMGAVQVEAYEMDEGTLKAIDMIEEMGHDLKTTEVGFMGYYA